MGRRSRPEIPAKSRSDAGGPAKSWGDFVGWLVRCGKAEESA
jgi:hypothetical protein